MSIIVSPSILSADFAKLGSEVERAEAAGADWIHVDVMDGHFVPNLTIGPPVVKSLGKMATVPLDVHLMITEPYQYLEDYADAGATYITVHAEACRHLQKTLAHIRKLGKKAGLALNPATHQDALQYVAEDIDLVLVMTVNPGFGGQKFIPEVLPKISAIRQIFDRLGKKDVHISVDGGINPDTAKMVTAAGANVLVAGSMLYGAPDMKEAMKSLRQAEKPLRVNAESQVRH